MHFHASSCFGQALVSACVEQLLDDVRARLRAAHRVVVLTGAGISTDSGIPDFRGPSGVWTKDPAAERTVGVMGLPSQQPLGPRSPVLVCRSNGSDR